MKNCLFFSFLCSFGLNAQLQWRPLSSAITNIDNQRFDDIFFLDANLGWAANGAYAAVYKTTDGGTTWTTQITEQLLGGNYYFRNIEFLDENIGFLGTLNGVFFKTTDGGTTWDLVTNLPNNPPAICGLDAINSTTMIGCGTYFSPAFLIKSSDSGKTWEYTDMSAYATALVEVLFENENIGYASGADSNGGIILKTSDGGLTWNAIYNSNIPGEFVWKLQILASNPNVIFGAVEANDPNLGKMIRSVDQGVSWVSKQVPYTSVQGIGFLSETHGWIGGYTSAAGTNFPFMETTDGGDTWFDAGVGGNLNKIFFLSDQLAYAAGATIYKFSDTGLSSPNFVETNRVPLNAKILPTPVTDKLNLTVQFNDADHLVIELFDSLGRRLKTFQFDTIKQAGTKNYSFDFQYPSGTYFLNLHNDTGRQSIKFTK